MFPSLFGFQMPPRPKSQEDEEEEDPNRRTLISGAPLIKIPYKPDEDEPPTRTCSWRSSTSTPPDPSSSNSTCHSAGKVGGISALSHRVFQKRFKLRAFIRTCPGPTMQMYNVLRSPRLKQRHITCYFLQRRTQ